MPFFLVTHTSLVEADCAEAAAQSVVAALRSGCEVSVAVKSDEMAYKTVAAVASSSTAVEQAVKMEAVMTLDSTKARVAPVRAIEENRPGEAPPYPGRSSALRQIAALGIISAMAIWFLL